MSRWHESGCKRPDVEVLGDVPCCQYCFAIPSLEDESTLTAPSIPPLPQLRSRVRMNLTWPSVVSYSRRCSSPTDRAIQAPMSPDEVSGTKDAKNQAGPPESKYNLSIFPEITSADGIRLLRLSPGRAGGLIHADIELACLRSSSRPIYDALSYTRGDESGNSTGKCPIFIGPYWDIVYVTHNCADALRCMQHQQADRLLWVDSLCINQENPDEKSRQVGLMREIYTNAFKVIAYLGGASANSEIALGFLKTASAGLLIPDRVADNDQKSRTALKSLFQRPYFSRLWVIQEALLARDLELACGQHLVSLRNFSSVLDVSYGPSWLFDRSSWHGFVDSDILPLLLNTSTYKCSDPRDKVFGILGLMRVDFSPDYRLSAECVYAGFTAYLIKNCLAFEVLAISGAAKKEFVLPSWVPDWSQKLVQKFPEDILRREEPEMGDVILDTAAPFVFDSITDSDAEINLDSETWSLQIPAVKLCDISGEISRVENQTNIAISMGQHGTLVITLLDQAYEFETDSVFLLSGWNRPVVLRHLAANSYSLVSVCTVSFGPPSSGTWLIPWDNPSMALEGEIKVSKFSPEENDLIISYHARLMELLRVDSSPTRADAAWDKFPIVRSKVIDFSDLTLTGLREAEERIRIEWNQLEQTLGWMFLDQVAVLQLILDVNRGSQEHRSGEGEMQLEDIEVTRFGQHGGVQFPLTYEWDLGRFCWSFTRPPAQGIVALNNTWTPVLTELKSRLPEVQRWAEVTEQLLNVFDYSQMVLGESWTSFPGTHLASKWRSNWETFRNVVGSDMQGLETQPGETGCFWDWCEFKDGLRLREELWEQQVPHGLDPHINCNMAVRVGMKSLGLRLDHQTMINIM